jgi:tripeptidyl-peptidase I
VSVSYSQDEASVTARYANRQCTEYAKVGSPCSLSYFSDMNFDQLGMMGTSVLYSSGDDGVAGGNGLCLDSQGLSIFISFNFVYFDRVF